MSADLDPRLGFAELGQSGCHHTESRTMQKIDVGVLGATGMVGQQFITRLANHPWFRVSWLAASERSEGKRYADAAPGRLATPMPDSVRDMKVDGCVPGRGPTVVF